MTTTTRFCRRPVFLTVAAFVFFATGIELSAAADGLAARHQSDDVCTSCKTHHGTSKGGSAPVHACVRAGDPHRIAWYAKPSRNKRDTFGYVGGNAVRRGEPRTPDEGTWGLDYAGLFSRHRIWLGWLHGQSSRQTGGSYTADGPHLPAH